MWDWFVKRGWASRGLRLAQTREINPSYRFCYYSAQLSFSYTSFNALKTLTFLMMDLSVLLAWFSLLHGRLVLKNVGYVCIITY